MINGGEIFQTDRVEVLIKKLGVYCYEYKNDHHIMKVFYQGEQEANQALEANDNRGAIRKTQLEDVYTALIETKVNEGGN